MNVFEGDFRLLKVSFYVEVSFLIKKLTKWN